jgi:hypothetical protein
MGQPEEKRPLARPCGRWNDNIKMNVKGIGWEGVRRDLLNSVMIFRFP